MKRKLLLSLFCLTSFIALKAQTKILATANMSIGQSNNYSIVEQPKIVITTTQAIGETIALGVNAASIDQSNIWIDLNNNAIQDEGESITDFGMDNIQNYALGSQIITLYGKVTKFKVNNNQLTSLDITSNEILTDLDVAYNSKLMSLDVSHNKVLTYLSCTNTGITSLDVSANIALSSLYCSNTSISTLDVSANTALKLLYCYNTAISSIDVSTNTLLTYFFCDNTNITSLDVSANTVLKILYCYETAIISLDVSANTALTDLLCYSTSMTSLNIANGNNNSISAFNASGNPMLSCIQVDAGFTPPSSWQKDAVANWSSTPCAPYVAVTGISLNKTVMDLVPYGSELLTTTMSPLEATFDSVTWQSSNPSIATVDHTGKVTGVALGSTEITVTTYDGSFTDKCQVTIIASPKISLTTTKAIGEMISLLINVPVGEQAHAWIDLNDNGIKESGEQLLDFDSKVQYMIASQTISVYANLTSFDCKENALTILNVSQAEALMTLECSKNSLSSIDLSNNLNLQTLDISSNAITALDLTMNTGLIAMNCNSNKLSTLNISDNIALSDLFCNSNQLTQLDLTHNKSLHYLACSNNQLTLLDIGSNNTLIGIDCSSNQLTSLDFSTYNALRFLDCHANDLTKLIVANNGNAEFESQVFFPSSNFAFNALNNDDLLCIQIDSGFDPSTNDGTDNKWLKENTASWSDKPCGTGIDDLNSSSVEVWSNKGCIYLENLELGDTFVLTEILGKVIVKKIVTGSKMAIEIPKGFYVLRINNQTYKLIVS